MTNRLHKTNYFLCLISLLLCLLNSCEKKEKEIVGSNETYIGKTIVSIYNYDSVIYQLYKDGTPDVTMGAATGEGSFTHVKITFTGTFNAINEGESHSIDIRKNQVILDVLSAYVSAYPPERNITICIQNGKF